MGDWMDLLGGVAGGVLGGPLGSSVGRSLGAGLLAQQAANQQRDQQQLYFQGLLGQQQAQTAASIDMYERGWANVVASRAALTASVGFFDTVPTRDFLAEARAELSALCPEGNDHNAGLPVRAPWYRRFWLGFLHLLLRILPHE